MRKSHLLLFIDILKCLLTSNNFIEMKKDIENFKRFVGESADLSKNYPVISKRRKNFKVYVQTQKKNK